MQLDIKTFFDGDSLKFNKERWTYLPEGYADFLDTRKFIEGSILSNIKNETFSCLDIGSGSGIWVQVLRQLGCTDYCAVDISSEMLKHNGANKKLCCDVETGVPQVLLSHKFDIILLIHSLEYIKNAKGLIEDCIKILSDNGVVIIVTKNRFGYIWRGVKCVADTFSISKLDQNWRTLNDFKLPNTKNSVVPLDIRVPTMLNNVNDNYSFKGDGDGFRTFICENVNPFLKKFASPYNPFSWHQGITIQRI